MALAEHHIHQLVVGDCKVVRRQAEFFSNITFCQNNVSFLLHGWRNINICFASVIITIRTGKTLWFSPKPIVLFSFRPWPHFGHCLVRRITSFSPFHFVLVVGAQGGTRTRTPIRHQILNLRRLPLRHSRIYQFLIGHW